MHTAKKFIEKHHYAKTCPSSTKFAIGLIHKNKLVGVGIWGYGVRPMHTIKKLFPSLDTKDYLECNRLCVLDNMPRNTESMFISLMVKFIKKHYPAVLLLFSWADGLRGKPGFIYQACSWFYGGFIWSEFYLNNRGEAIHPRLLITRFGRRDKVFYRNLGLKKVFGKQFRYCKFLCGIGMKKRLLKQSTVHWSLDYPKYEDIEYKYPDGYVDINTVNLRFTKNIDKAQGSLHRWCKGNSIPDNQLGGVGVNPTRCIHKIEKEA